MPPLLPLPPAPARSAFSPRFLTACLASFLQVRNASILSSLSDNPGAYSKRIRRGRGPSSGKGKTSGRGHKGQKQHGKVPARFQGGQTPLDIVKGKRGAVNHFSVEMSPINLNRIQQWIDQERLDPTKPITLKELIDSRCIHQVKDGVKLLAKGKEELRTPINVLVSRASAEAIRTVEALGGKVTTRYYSKPAIERLLKGTSISSFTPLGMSSDSDGSSSTTADASRPFYYRLPDPSSRKDIEYYRDSAHRGYLSHLVEEGQGPSLFFKKPRDRPAIKKKNSAKEKAKAENRLW